MARICRWWRDVLLVVILWLCGSFVGSPGYKISLLTAYFVGCFFLEFVVSFFYRCRILFVTRVDLVSSLFQRLAIWIAFCSKWKSLFKDIAVIIKAKWLITSANYQHRHWIESDVSAHFQGKIVCSAVAQSFHQSNLDCFQLAVEHHHLHGSSQHNHG